MTEGEPQSLIVSPECLLTHQDRSNQLIHGRNRFARRLF